MATGTQTRQSLAHHKTDPLRNFKFLVRVHHPKADFTANIGFMSVSGLNIATEVIPYREGGMNTTTQKMPGQSDFAPITLTRGLAVGNNQMMRWMRELFTVIQGTGNGHPGDNFRAIIDIKVLQHPVTSRIMKRAPVKAWFRVYNAWPQTVAFSDLDAGANAIIINQMTLAHEGFENRVHNSAGGDSVDPRAFNSGPGSHGTN
jgi:phage tail-like protein